MKKADFNEFKKVMNDSQNSVAIYRILQTMMKTMNKMSERMDILSKRIDKLQEED